MHCYQKQGIVFDPLHFDDEFARNEVFDERIAHGMLVGSLVSTVLGTKQGAQDVPHRRINCRYVQLVKDVPHPLPSLKVENPHSERSIIRRQWKLCCGILGRFQ